MGVKNGFTACNPDLLTPLWIPAFAGMTELFKGLRREREKSLRPWPKLRKGLQRERGLFLLNEGA